MRTVAGRLPAVPCVIVVLLGVVLTDCRPLEEKTKESLSVLTADPAAVTSVLNYFQKSFQDLRGGFSDDKVAP